MGIWNVHQDHTNQWAPCHSPYVTMTKNGSESGSQSEDSAQKTFSVVTKYRNIKADSQGRGGRQTSHAFRFTEAKWSVDNKKSSPLYIHHKQHEKIAETHTSVTEKKRCHIFTKPPATGTYWPEKKLKQTVLLVSELPGASAAHIHLL